MKSSIIIFDQFTDIDLFLMWDLLNRVWLPGWEVRILGERSQHISATGIAVPTHGMIDEANNSGVVLFVSGQGTRTNRMGHRKESERRMEATHIEIDQTGWGRAEFCGRP